MSMIISIMSITAFVMMTVYMMFRASFTATRRVALVPLAMSGLEVMMFGLVSGVTNPAVMMLLVAARLVILGVCCAAMHHDREAMKARVRLRNRFRADMYNTMEPLRVIRRQRAAAHIDIAA